MTDLERIARVLAESWRKEAQQRAVEAGCDVLVAIDPFLERAIPVVRTVLAAARVNGVPSATVRLPGGEVVSIPWGGHGEPPYPGDDAIFNTKIDHILAEKG